jgi:hypothetical protein
VVTKEVLTVHPIYYVVLVILDFSVEGIRASRLSPPSLAMGTDLEIKIKFLIQCLIGLIQVV